MTVRHRLWIVSLAAWLAASVASAQPGFTVSLGSAANAVGDPGLAADRRQTVVGGVEADHVLQDGRVRLFYEFDGGTYTTQGDWRYLLHAGGATWRIPLGGAESTRTLYITGTGSWRANGDSWAAADYRAVGVMANVEMHPSATTTVRAGYRLDGRVFPDLPALDQVQHDGFVSALRSFPSRTTIIGEVHVGAKSYAATIDTEWIDLSSFEAPNASGLAGRGMGPGLRGSARAAVPVATVTANTAGAITAFGRVAQSLTDRTGAWLQYSRRKTFGRVPPVVVTTPALFFDDGVYDDPFAANARAVSAAMKHQFASGILVEVDVARMLKDYTGTLALDLAGDPVAGSPLRADRIWRGSAGISVPLWPAKTGAFSIDLDMAYYFTQHRSNDAFYQYTAHGVATGLTIGY